MVADASLVVAAIHRPDQSFADLDAATGLHHDAISARTLDPINRAKSPHPAHGGIPNQVPVDTVPDLFVLVVLVVN